MNEDDGFADEVAWSLDRKMRAWLENDAFKRTADYVQRGHAHRGMTDEALIETWAENMKRHCRNPDDHRIFRDQNDLDAELELRKLEAPLETVKDYLEIRRQYFVSCLESMKSNPEKWESFHSAIKEDAIEFLIELEEPREKCN